MSERQDDEHENFLSERNATTIIAAKQNEKNDQLLSQEAKTQLLLCKIGEINCKSNSPKLGLFHQALLTIAVLILTAGCGMPIGYSVVILPQLYNSTDTLKMDIEIGSWFASVHSLAVPVGAFMSGSIADYFGRKPALLGSIIPLLIGWMLIALSSSHFMLIAGRIMAGIAVGLIAAPSQILLAECAEPKLRGFTIGAPYVSYSLGILLAYSLGVILHWRHVAWCSTLLPMISILCLCAMPESPAWLVRHGQIDRAIKSLKWLRCCETKLKSELIDLVERMNSETTKSIQTNESVWMACRSRDVIKPMIIINGFHILLIFSGTYLVVFYAVDIIADLGVDFNTMTAAVYTALVRLICTFAFCFMLFYINRRTLIISAGIGSCLSSIILSTFIYMRLDSVKTILDLYVTAICILFYVASNTGFMVMPGIMIGELIPSRVRGRVGGYVYAAFNFLLFIVIKVFPQLNYSMKTHGIFFMFGLASAAATSLVYFMLPETNKKTLGEIEDYFRQKNWFWQQRERTKNNNKVLA